ncbi:hypothetical protein HDU96_000298 [Phlyctochytrium bullatum]|nr:hypothetical protein HDU96_000298 [Phlyctochytrium bullatum]
MHLLKTLLAASLLATLAAAQTRWPVYERDGKQAVLDAIKRYVADGEAAFRSANLSRLPSPENWADEVVYHIVPDRFNDGNPANNNLNLPRNGQANDQPVGNYYNVNEWRHGGDLKGIQDRIDYIADLGATVLWITPIAKHDGAYHGYCTTDPTQVDPGFGTLEDYRNLVQYAHSKGIKVVQDIVVNHLCDPDTKYQQPTTNHYDCVQSLWDASWSGSPSEGRNRGRLSFSPNFFGPLQSQAFYSRCGPNQGDDTTGQGSASVFGDFVDGMFDYDTRNYDFQEVITELHKFWVAYADIDGFRLDAVKHVTEDFLAHFSTYMRDYANSLGKSNFYVIGEVAADVNWQGRRLGNMFHNPSNPDDHGAVPASLTYKIKQLAPVYRAHPRLKYPGMNAVYDFFLGGTTRDVILSYNQKADGTSDKFETSPARIGDYFGNQYKVVASQGTPMNIAWVPLEIHDWPRLLRDQLSRDPVGTLSFGMAFLLTMQGQPIIYYGSEQGLTGNCPSGDKITGGTAQAYTHILDICSSGGYDGNSHSTSRAGFFMSSPWRLRTANPTTDALAAIGRPEKWVSRDWRSDPMLDLNSFVYVHTRRLIRIRRTCGALRNGATFIRRTDDYGLIAFSRISQAYEAVVLMNVKRSGPYTVNSYAIYVDAGVPENTQFVNVLNPRVVATVRSANGGKVLDFGPGNLTLDQRGYAIFVPQAVLGNYSDYHQTWQCKY